MNSTLEDYLKTVCSTLTESISKRIYEEKYFDTYNEARFRRAPEMFLSDEKICDINYINIRKEDAPYICFMWSERDPPHTYITTYVLFSNGLIECSEHRSGSQIGKKRIDITKEKFKGKGIVTFELIIMIMKLFQTPKSNPYGMIDDKYDIHEILEQQDFFDLLAKEYEFEYEKVLVEKDAFNGNECEQEYFKRQEVCKILKDRYKNKKFPSKWDSYISEVTGSYQNKQSMKYKCPFSQICKVDFILNSEIQYQGIIKKIINLYLDEQQRYLPVMTELHEQIQRYKTKEASINGIIEEQLKIRMEEMKQEYVLETKEKRKRLDEFIAIKQQNILQVEKETNEFQNSTKEEMERYKSSVIAKMRQVESGVKIQLENLKHIEKRKLQEFLQTEKRLLQNERDEFELMMHHERECFDLWKDEERNRLLKCEQKLRKQADDLKLERVKMLSEIQLKESEMRKSFLEQHTEEILRKEQESIKMMETSIRNILTNLPLYDYFLSVMGDVGDTTTIWKYDEEIYNRSPSYIWLRQHGEIDHVELCHSLLPKNIDILRAIYEKTPTGLNKVKEIYTQYWVRIHSDNFICCGKPKEDVVRKTFHLKLMV
jgi:hypothetical protein